MKRMQELCLQRETSHILVLLDMDLWLVRVTSLKILLEILPAAKHCHSKGRNYLDVYKTPSYPFRGPIAQMFKYLQAVFSYVQLITPSGPFPLNKANSNQKIHLAERVPYVKHHLFLVYCREMR